MFSLNRVASASPQTSLSTTVGKLPSQNRGWKHITLGFLGLVIGAEANPKKVIMNDNTINYPLLGLVFATAAFAVMAFKHCRRSAHNEQAAQQRPNLERFNPPVAAARDDGNKAASEVLSSPPTPSPANPLNEPFLEPEPKLEQGQQAAPEGKPVHIEKAKAKSFEPSVSAVPIPFPAVVLPKPAKPAPKQAPLNAPVNLNPPQASPEGEPVHAKSGVKLTDLYNPYKYFFTRNELRENYEMTMEMFGEDNLMSMLAMVSNNLELMAVLDGEITRVCPPKKAAEILNQADVEKEREKLKNLDKPIFDALTVCFFRKDILKAFLAASAKAVLKEDSSASESYKGRLLCKEQWTTMMQEHPRTMASMIKCLVTKVRENVSTTRSSIRNMLGDDKVLRINIEDIDILQKFLLQYDIQLDASEKEEKADAKSFVPSVLQPTASAQYSALVLPKPARDSLNDID